MKRLLPILLLMFSVGGNQMRQLIFIFALCGLLVPSAYGETSDPFERDCKRTFDSPTKWAYGYPSEYDWAVYCWDYVEKRGGKWYWLGSKETRKKEAARKQLEQKRKAQEEKRRREEAEKKRAEEERKKAERLAE